MTNVVVDASITASWLLPDEGNDFALEIYKRIGECEIFVPALWNYEIRNILIINERRGRITMEAADAAFGFLADLGINIDHNADWRTATDLARQFKLTIYDAAYLELAVRKDLPIATLDKALIAAAAQLGRLAGNNLVTP